MQLLKGSRQTLEWKGSFEKNNHVRRVASFNYFAEKKMNIINPATGKEIKTNLSTDSELDIKTKVIKARAAQNSWAAKSLQQRKDIIAIFNKFVQEEVEGLSSTLTSETGKPISQAKNEVTATQGRVQFFLDKVDSVIQSSVRRSNQGLSEEIRHEPLGVVANISAWNYPFFVGVNVFIPALLTGNSVIYKPSEHVALTGLQIAKLLHKSGVPEDVFSVVIGGGDVAQHLLAQPIDGVFFTGSNQTGDKIAKQTAGRMIPVQLELGGKDPTYVCEDVDVAKAAASLADGAFYNTGQSCCSVERIYVHQNIYKDFVDKFVAEVKGFKVGDPADKDTYIGPLTLPTQPSFLEAQVVDAVTKGAKVLLGGKKSTKPNYFEPTVLVNVNHTMDVMIDESFGPIIGIQQVSGDEEAVRLMNDCKYGLTAGVYTKSKDRAEGILTKINSGTVYWNACDRVSPHLPWNGRKGSGIGSTLGLEGILAFTKLKSWHLIG